MTRWYAKRHYQDLTVEAAADTLANNTFTGRFRPVDVDAVRRPEAFGPKTPAEWF